MEISPAIVKGCLLGMAVGDAMGAPVDGKAYPEICRMYGPKGLLGYDSANGLAEITSYSQLAMFAANGLLAGAARGKTSTDDQLRYITAALKEWARVQHLPGAPENRICWLRHIPQMRRRRCMDPRTLDALTRGVLGTPEAPANQGAGPGTLTAVIPVALFFQQERMEFWDIGSLGAKIVALTHGDSMAYLSGALLAYAVAGIVHDRECSVENQFLHAAQAVASQFPGVPSSKLLALIQEAVALAKNPGVPALQAMERLECNTAARVLAGAVYAVLSGNGDFDTSMITAVNHSGKSAAVGAVTGAILGTILGEQGLPGFYLDCLDCDHVIREVAFDLHTACPTGWQKRLFDDDWDRKYTQGKPVSGDGWIKA